jgi:hypothetical protein
MSDNSSPQFDKTIAYLFCIVVSIAMIWYLLLAIFYCDTCSQKPLAYAFLLAFILIIAYASFGLFRMLLPGKRNHVRFVLCWRKNDSHCQISNTQNASIQNAVLKCNGFTNGLILLSYNAVGSVLIATCSKRMISHIGTHAHLGEIFN